MDRRFPGGRLEALLGVIYFPSSLDLHIDLSIINAVDSLRGFNAPKKLPVQKRARECRELLTDRMAWKLC